MSITYTHTITPEEFSILRAAVGWGAIEIGQAAKCLENSAFIICTRDGEKAIGMARVITDYGYIVYIADVIVIPEYQGKGFGREIMSRIMAYITDKIAPGQYKFVSLLSAKGKEPFYEKYGLIKRPTDSLGCGMSLHLEKQGEIQS